MIERRNMNKTLISVVMPAYNAKEYINDAIKSVLEQTYSSLELIIVDDCSTDETLDIIRGFAETDKRVRFYENDKNIGVAMTRNRGMSHASGEWVAFIDADDMWYPEKLERQLSLALSETADVIYCSYALVRGVDGVFIKDYIVPRGTDYKEMLKENVMSASTVMLRREITEKYLFGDKFVHEDYVYWLSLVKSDFKCVGAADILSAYRVNRGSRSENKLRAAKNRWEIYRKSERLSLFKALAYFMIYAVRGIVKYKF